MVTHDHTCVVVSEDLWYNSDTRPHMCGGVRDPQMYSGDTSSDISISGLHKSITQASLSETTIEMGLGSCVWL